MAPLVSSVQHSNYIVSQDPSRFGGKQAEYEAEVEQIVEETAQRFSLALQTGEDLEALFFKTLEDFGKRRNDIATRHGTPYAERFGVRRDDERTYNGASLFTSTCLNGLPYSEYQTQVLNFIQTKLREMNPHPTFGFQEKFKRFECPSVLGRRVAIDIEIFSIDQFLTWLFPFTLDGARTVSRLADYPVPDSDVDLNQWFSAFFNHIGAMGRLKKTAFEVYKKIKLFIWINRNNKLSQVLITDHVFMTHRIEVDGKMGALSQCVTWLNRDGIRDPIEAMKTLSSVELVHQDMFLVKTMLNEAGKVFKSALTCDPRDLKTLKGRVALWTTVFDNAMPFERGSSAASEWYQKAIYRALGHRLTYKTGKLINLEVLTKPFSQVMAEYDSMVEVSELSSLS